MLVARQQHPRRRGNGRDERLSARCSAACRLAFRRAVLLLLSLIRPRYYQIPPGRSFRSGKCSGLDAVIRLSCDDPRRDALGTVAGVRSQRSI